MQHQGALGRSHCMAAQVHLAHTFRTLYLRIINKVTVSNTSITRNSQKYSWFYNNLSTTGSPFLLVMGIIYAITFVLASGKTQYVKYKQKRDIWNIIVKISKHVELFHECRNHFLLYMFLKTSNSLRRVNVIQKYNAARNQNYVSVLHSPILM